MERSIPAFNGSQLSLGHSGHDISNHVLHNPEKEHMQHLYGGPKERVEKPGPIRAIKLVYPAGERSVGWGGSIPLGLYAILEKNYLIVDRVLYAKLSSQETNPCLRPGLPGKVPQQIAVCNNPHPQANPIPDLPSKYSGEDVGHKPVN
ncbi:hypothetical protein PGTUg99_021361 [Puccinia graminis f. sp. tritici]|uniref:Uncharacterized protein n=1 Tax=Puccinia graminis f. sp. tritici TaxID=56615 RepID=A0A5B0RWR6_PUCGR|nr:hypothetical protein PGTUg99_021361 [Puccinia graminis f. sp. tritici]